MKKTSEEIMNILDQYIENPVCSLNYNKDYELLIAVMLSAQSTDAVVNKVTKVLFDKYDIFSLTKANVDDIVEIIRPCGNMNKKAIFVLDIANSLVRDYNGVVPNNREYLESLKGVGHKTCNVVLSNLFNVPTFAVDTHVLRVSKRLGITKINDDEKKTEEKLMKFFPKDKWIRLHHQMVLFGRYYCKAKKPECECCKMKEFCKFGKCK